MSKPIQPLNEYLLSVAAKVDRETYETLQKRSKTLNMPIDKLLQTCLKTGIALEVDAEMEACALLQDDTNGDDFDDEDDDEYDSELEDDEDSSLEDDEYDEDWDDDED